MTQDDWDELYLQIYSAYQYSLIHNEPLKDMLGTVLKKLMKINPSNTSN
jgi:hypothetical protein